MPATLPWPPPVTAACPAGPVRLKLTTSRDPGKAMPFEGRSKGSVDHEPDAVARALRESARETIAALDHLAALFDGGRRWIRNKECDGKGRFCLRGGIAHVAAGVLPRHYLKLAIRELAGPSMTIPAYNDNAPSFASIAYVIDRARELAAAAEANRQT